jgi:hypothetical protein
MTLFTDESAHPLPILTALTAKYGPDWMEWQYPVLRETLSRDGINISKVNLAKAMAAAAVATRDEFWQYWETFHFLCQALSGHIPNAESLQEHTIGDMMVAVDTAVQLRQHLKELTHMPEFSEEVAQYVAHQALEQGVWYLPAPLAFANPFTVKKTYHCKDCGNEGPLWSDDGLCDSCVGRFETEQLREWKPDPELVARGRGKNIEIFEKNPSAPVIKKLDELLAGKGLPLRENAADNCAGLLLAGLTQLSESHKKMVEKAP